MKKSLKLKHVEYNAPSKYKIKIISKNIPEIIPTDTIFNIDRDIAEKIHSMGNPYPAKFIPEIPRWAIQKYTKKNDLVLDPFVGSGTTMIESRLLYRNCVGIDHNPLSKLMAKTKSTYYDFKILKKIQSEIKSMINVPHKDEINLVEFRNRDFWFDVNASIAIEKIKQCISYFDDELIRDFLLVTLSETIQNVSKVGNGQILPATRNKFKKHKKISQYDVFESFNCKLQKNIERSKIFSQKINKKNYSKIIGNDARNIKFSRKIDLIVTSPPYINAHHYIWTHKLRLLQLALINDKERLELMRKEIGTEEISSKTTIPILDIPELNSKIKDIITAKNYKATGNQNKIRGLSTAQYFRDMELHFINAYKMMKDGSVYCITVGDNTICKVSIPTTKYIIEMAQKIGFVKIMDFKILLKNRTLNIPKNVNWSGTIKYDNVVIFTKK